MVSKTYKHKYIAIDEIYEQLGDNIDISLKEYKKLLKSFYNAFTQEVVYSREVVHLPNNMGYCYIKKNEHKRPFHIRVDWAETKKQGELVKYKVPILDDYYYKLMWHRKGTMGKCKIMPLALLKDSIKDFTKENDF